MNPIVKADVKRILKMVNLAPLRGKRVLITGGNGFIGQYLVQTIHYANQTQNLRCRIVSMSRSGPNKFLRRLLPNKYLSFKAMNLAKPFKLSGRFDYIFHAACHGQPALFFRNPLETIELNVGATRRLLELARVSKARFLFFSSAEIYGVIPRGMRSLKETYSGSCDPMNPRSIYGESKRLGETLVALYSRQYGVKGKVIRISHLYGPGLSIKDTRVLGDFLRGALFRGKIKLQDKGAAVKTMGYVADAVAMMFHAILRGREDIYNVGGRDSMSIRELAETVGNYLDVPVSLPASVSKKRHIGHDPGRVKLDLSRIKREMKKLVFTSFKKGIANTIEWNRQEFL